MNVFTADLGPDTEVISNFIVLARRLAATTGMAAPTMAVAFPHIQLGVDASDCPLATMAVSRRLADKVTDDRIRCADVSDSGQREPLLIEAGPRYDGRAIVLLLLSPQEMIEPPDPPGVRLVAEATAARLHAASHISRYGYLFVMEPGSHLAVRPRFQGHGAIERCLVVRDGGLDLIARDLDSCAPVEVACIAA